MSKVPVSKVAEVAFLSKMGYILLKSDGSFTVPGPQYQASYIKEAGLNIADSHEHKLITISMTAMCSICASLFKSTYPAIKDDSKLIHELLNCLTVAFNDSLVVTEAVIKELRKRQ